MENACFRTLVNDVFGKVKEASAERHVKAHSSGKVSQRSPETVITRLVPKISGQDIVSVTRSRLEKVGLLSTNEEPDVNERGADII